MGKYILHFKHSLNELVNTKNGRDAKTQCKEYGVSRYVFLGIALYGMLTLGRFMWAYPSFYEMFIKSGAYAWLCEEGMTTRAVEGVAGEVTCEVRDMAINSVLLAVTGSTFMGSIFASAANVALGAKISSMIGTSSMFIGIVTLGFSSRSFRMYIPGAVMVGLGMDFIVFPSFNATMLFPKRKLLITSLLTSTISAGMFIPILMKYMVWELNFKFSYLMLTYAVLTAGVLFVLFMLYYPPRRFYEQCEIDNAYQLSNMESQLESPCKHGDSRRVAWGDASSRGSRRSSRRDRLLSVFGVTGAKFELLKSSMLSFHFLLLALIFTIITIAATFYVIITSRLYNQGERAYLSVGIASSFGVAIAVSPFLDKLGSMPIMWYEVVCLLASMILVILPHHCTKILSIVSYSLFTAYNNGQIWLFAVETFDPEINTLILGTLNVLAGLVTFSASAVFQELLTSFGWITQILIFVDVLVGLQLMMVATLHYLKKKVNKIQ
ncbi:major facilitator superfamily MFS-1 protein [Theileria orientalis]|uniref:Major facilitator superfamily MFS-1 protein n=1 Tax=Theileria orientalis TaxID=68886 RepID=A0A976M862_THEOR|nr:major facilitator superfamily MFS-1 protein [Theileria orientalis]